jgi:hypothetical protein
MAATARQREAGRFESDLRNTGPKPELSHRLGPFMSLEKI